MKGVVKSFSRLKGYGFIQSEELEHEVFVHYTNIDDMDGFKTLSINDKVEFNIDVEKTQENGKKVCEAYAPLIQQRIRLKMRLPLHTGSLIQVSSDIKSGNGIESEYINRIMKEGDQVDCFLNYIDEMIEMDEKAGKYLKYKLVDELTDEEITLKLGVSRRALYGIKPNAYFRIAIWSHQVAYIKENTYEFIFNYAGLYERLK